MTIYYFVSQVLLGNEFDVNVGLRKKRETLPQRFFSVLKISLESLSCAERKGSPLGLKQTNFILRRLFLNSTSLCVPL